jgi:hypothetical protein
MTQAAHDGKLSTTNGLLLGILILVLIYPPLFYATARHERDCYRTAAERRELTEQNEHFRQEIQALHAELSAAHAQIYGQHDPRDHYQIIPGPQSPPLVSPQVFELDDNGHWIKKGFEHPPEPKT